MHNLWIFNPDTDIARGEGRHIYTPTAKVREVRRKMALCQASFASYGDLILLLDHQDHTEIQSLENFDLVQKKGIHIIHPEKLTQLDWNIINPKPWGWDHSIKEILLRHGATTEALPSEEYIDCLRELSHRRTTIYFHRLMAKRDIYSGIPVPMEFTNIKDAGQWIKANPDAIIKAPWSSSGRGIISTSEMTEDSIIKWISAILKKQGSVLAEVKMKKSIDFATEWDITRENGPCFLGLSLFRTDGRCKYCGNIRLSQKEIRNIISTSTHLNIDEIISAQQFSLSELIVPHYTGPLGIDMLISKTGEVNSCIEINLRYTMGHLSL